MAFAVSRQGNKIGISGVLAAEYARIVLATVHQCVHIRAYSDFELDFSECTAAFPAAMLPLCAQVIYLKQAGVEVRLRLPDDDKAARLFINSNWAGLISDQFPLDSFRGHLQVPAMRFSNGEEQKKLVDRVMASMLKSTQDFRREDFAVVEWALSEITDNVINHSGSPIGGLMQFSSRHISKRVDFVVCDFGRGISSTLAQQYKSIQTDIEALELSIQEGITSDPATCQGNGLFGSAEVARRSGGGFFGIHSGHGSLFTDAPNSLRLRNEKIPMNGTVVDVCLSYAVPNVLANALRFKDETYHPIDFIFSRYQSDAQDGELIFKVSAEADGVNSRPAGRPVRQQLLNLFRVCSDRVNIDFTDVPVISSSFADEAIGKLVREVGPESFKSRFRLVGMTETIQLIIFRAISQRLNQPFDL